MQLYLQALALLGILHIATEPTLALKSNMQRHTGFVNRLMSRRATSPRTAMKDRLRRQASGITTSFSLSTNTSPDCGTGLTHAGVYVQFEYRLVTGEVPDNWISLSNVTLNPTSKTTAVQHYVCHAYTWGCAEL